MRLIDADLLIQDTIQEYARSKQYRDAVTRMVNKAPTVEPKQEWIPCSERLPNESDYYLVTLRNVLDEIGICVVWFAHESDYGCGSEWREITDNDTVLSWMPLPEPWKGADDEVC